MQKGWLILAHGKDHYLKWAANLIGSLKMLSSLPVALVTDRIELPQFCHPDIVVKLPIEYNKPFYAKTILNQLTPFDETIYLDSDSLCVMPPDDEFNRGVDFDIHCVGRYASDEDYQSRMIWANIPDMRRFYGWKNQKYIETNSSFIYWKNGLHADRIFALAESLYAANFYPHYNFQYFSFYPDELAWNAALTYMGETPEKGSPVLIHYHDSGNPKIHRNTKPFISLCGIDTTHQHLYQYYDRERIRLLGNRSYKMKRDNKAVNRYANQNTTIYKGLRDRNPNEIKMIMGD